MEKYPPSYLFYIQQKLEILHLITTNISEVSANYTHALHSKDMINSTLGEFGNLRIRSKLEVKERAHQGSVKDGP